MLLSCADLWNPWGWEFVHWILFHVFRDIPRMWSRKFFWILKLPKMQLVLNQSLKFHFNHSHTKEKWLLSQLQEPLNQLQWSGLLMSQSYRMPLFILFLFSNFQVPLWHFMPLPEWRISPHFTKLNLILLIVIIFIFSFIPPCKNSSIPASFYWVLLWEDRLNILTKLLII